MGADIFAAYLIHPMAIAVGVVILFALSALQYRRKVEPPPIVPIRLVAGYLSMFIVCTAFTAISSYVPETEAATKWHVPAERYWQVQINAFLTELVLLAYVSLVGIAMIGLPIIFSLSRRGLATIPLVLLASAAISALLAALLTSSNEPPFQHLAYMAAYFAGTHLLLSFAFCLGAGIPWRRHLIE